MANKKSTIFRSPIEIAFWLFTLSVFFGLLLPVLLKKGMFLDGLTYSTISRNLAEGLGTFWKPHYTDTVYQVFREQPPLVFFLQSLFFRLTDDHFLTERIFSLLTAVISGFLIVRLWGLFEKNQSLVSLSWVPLLLWIVTPVVFWSYQNNMLENSVTIFILSAAVLSLRGIPKNKILNIHFFLAGVFIALAVFSKGPIGLFPVFFPIIYFSVFRNQSVQKTMYQTLILLFPIVIIIILILICSSEGTLFLKSYFSDQIVASIKGERELAVGGRIFILKKLFIELIPIFLISIIMVLLEYKKTRKSVFNHFKNKTFLFCFFIGLSGSLPLLISPKQSGFYLVPAIPFFALAFSLLLKESLVAILIPISKRTGTYFAFITGTLLVVVLTFSIFQTGKTGRDQNLQTNLEKLANYVPEGSILESEGEICSDWLFIAYAARLHKLNIDCSKVQREYVLLKADDPAGQPMHSKYINTGMDQFNLYTRFPDTHE